MMGIARAPRSFWILLLIGFGLRCVALNQPLVDAHLIRQCQTAAATKSLLTEPGFSLSSRIPWQGDLDTRYILELPLYNYLTLGIHYFVGNLDVSGKLTSILLWTISFLCLQAIWRRMLDEREAMWANVMFVFSPLGVFYGQAFMPEMLVQALAFGIVLAMLRYREKPTLARWAAVGVLGLVGLLIKLPEIGHLYLIIAGLLFGLTGWRGLFAPRYLIAAGLTIMALKVWGNYTDSINTRDLPEWSTKVVIPGFIGSFDSRFHIRPWAMIVLYVGGIIVPGPAALIAGYGLKVFWREKRELLLGLWLLSIAVFYLVWFGNGGAAQSYYNLPVMAPVCALFGIGVNALLSSENIVRWRNPAMVAVALAVAIPSVPVLRYLFKQDRQILAAAEWVREHTAPGDIVLVRANHRYDMIDYSYNPVVAYYSGRPTFIWTKLTAGHLRAAALARASYAVMTLPVPLPGGVAGKLNQLRGISAPQLQPLDWVEAGNFESFTQEAGFATYRRRSAAGDH